mmetsp:Transcript_32909/g.37737  ORF Transcript_32909/g.37737 Transcript_32909/m.37737 type:complete len:92 (-) Transcript_32909:124-399(-)
MGDLHVYPSSQMFTHRSVCSRDKVGDDHCYKIEKIEYIFEKTDLQIIRNHCGCLFHSLLFCFMRGIVRKAFPTFIWILCVVSSVIVSFSNL